MILCLSLYDSHFGLSLYDSHFGVSAWHLKCTKHMGCNNGVVQ
jgi:hypothetical protein